jgi:hypothetical protein
MRLSEQYSLAWGQVHLDRPTIEGNMDSPLLRAGASQAVIRQIDAFADTHAGVAEQQEDISAQVVAAEQLLLQELILLRGERPWQTLRCARDIFAAQ